MTKKQIYSTIIFGVLFCFGLYDYLSNFKETQRLIAEREIASQIKTDTFYQRKKKEDFDLKQRKIGLMDDVQLIYELTHDQTIINYVKKHKKLPKYYLTKAKARELGWQPHLGNLCDILPGKAIGGDRFGNREGKLPKGKKYYEADVNYQCKKRNADRIIYTDNGEVWLTKDHYKTFVKQ